MHDRSREGRFDDLFTATYAEVLAFAIRRTEDRGTAEDVAAETFAVAWRRLEDVPGEPLGWLYAVAFVIGTVYTVAGSAAQIVLTQVVARDRLVEAHAKIALASSGAEVAGPGLAGALIKLLGAPLALIADALEGRLSV